MHVGIGATLVFGAVPTFALFLFLLAADAPLHLLQVAVGFFTADRSKKEVNQFAGLCDKQSPCMSGVLIFHIKSEW